MISKRFLKTSVIYTISGMLPMVAPIILLPFYLTLLSAEDFGALSVYYTISLFAQVLSTYSFDTSLYIHFHEFKRDKNKLRTFISSAFIFIAGIGALLFTTSIFTGDILFTWLKGENHFEFFPYGLLSVLTGVFQSLFKVNSSLMQSREEPETFFWSNLSLFLFISLLTIAGLYVFPDTLIGPIGGRMLAITFGGIWALTRIFKEFGIYYDFSLLKSSFGFNFYTFIYQVLQWVINYFDRFILLGYVTLTDLGVYDLAVKCLLAVEFIINGLHNSFYPKVVSVIMEQDRKQSSPEINRYYHGLTAVVMLIICLSILLIPFAIQIFVFIGKKSDYLKAVEYLPYVSLIYVVRVIRLYIAAPFSILKYTFPLPFLYTIISIIKIGVAIALMPTYGVRAVIFASIASSIMEIILLYLIIRKKFEFKFNVLKIIVAPLLLLLMIAIAEPLTSVINPVFIHACYLLFSFLILVWVYRNEIKLIKMPSFIK